MGGCTTPPSAEMAREFLEHGRAVRAERARAAAAGEAPDFARLVAQWGGVSLVYRRSMQDSPAYRLNHEEMAKFLEEGVSLHREPGPPRLRARPSTAAWRRWSSSGWSSRTGRIHPHRRAGAAARPHPAGGGRHLAQRHLRARAARHLRHRRPGPGLPRYRAVRPADGGGDAIRLEPAAPGEVGLLHLVLRKGGRFITFYGDNHPVYAGSVVKAMASAKDGYPHVAALFADDVAGLSPQEQPARDGRLGGVRRLGWTRPAAHRARGRPADPHHRRGGGARAGGRPPVPARPVLPPAELRERCRAARGRERRRAVHPLADGGPGPHRRLGRPGAQAWSR